MTFEPEMLESQSKAQ